MSGRPTPRLDQLLAALDGALTAHGAKADLARAIETEAGITLQAAKNRVSRILSRSLMPNGEDTLIIQEWLRLKGGTTTNSRRGRTR